MTQKSSIFLRWIRNNPKKYPLIYNLIKCRKIDIFEKNPDVLKDIISKISSTDAVEEFGSA